MDPPRRELQLPDDFNASFTRLLEYRLIHRDAGAYDDEIGPRQGFPPVAAKLQADAAGSQPVRAVEAVARLGERHQRAPLREQFRRRHAAAGRTDHHHATLPDGECIASHAITAASTSSD